MNKDKAINAWECNICGYISTDRVEVTECCDADAIYIDIVKVGDLKE